MILFLLIVLDIATLTSEILAVDRFFLRRHRNEIARDTMWE